MPIESWLKVGMPAFPVAFTIFGVWIYWGDNPLPALAPAIGFWGVVLLYYCFSNIVVVNRSHPLFVMVATTALWFASSITAHNLGRFLASNSYHGGTSVLSNKDFWYAYISSTFGCVLGLIHFVKYEPMIVAQVQTVRARIQQEEGK